MKKSVLPVDEARGITSTVAEFYHPSDRLFIYGSW